MERLTEKVYECNLAVEAHMVCDLLSQAGISARVDGEFLQSAAGEIPLGNTVKVRVDPARAAEAREVIADWEKLQPPPEPGGESPAKRSRFLAPLWFCGGLLVGLVVMFAVMRPHARDDSWQQDRNQDGRIDARWSADWAGRPDRYEEDNDFDGRFELQYEVHDGELRRGVLDSNFDGRPEQVWHLENGVLAGIDYFFASGGRVVKRQSFRGGLLIAAEYDDDGDGVFERRIEYDAHAEPKM